MYKKILVPTDGSDVSNRAASHAINLAKTVGASVKAIFVIDTRTFPGTHPIVPESMAPHYFSLLDEMRRAGDAAVHRHDGEAEKAGVTIEHEVVEGLPSTCILDAAAGMAADLIVMGTHGRSGFSALLLGSTAQACVHGAKQPVLLVR